MVNSNRFLNRIEWLHLIEMAPARYLLLVPPGMPIERLEVELRDLMENLEADEADEYRMLEMLQNILVQHRRKKTVTKGELLFVDVAR